MRVPFQAAIAFILAAACGSSPPPASSPPPGDPSHPRTYAEPPSSGPLESLPVTSPECRTCTHAPLYPTEDCADGLHLGGRGPCVRFANGRCGYSHLVCPATNATRSCVPGDCTLPAPSEWLCPDRKTRSYFACVADANGRCGATYRPCPLSARQAPPPPRPPPQPAPPRNPHPCTPLPSDDVLVSWPVTERCAPGTGPAQPPQTAIKSLGDGTSIIESLGRCLRVRYRPCTTACLPADARIATPAGEIAIADLRVGSEIWSADARGRRAVDRVARMTATPVGAEHHVARVRLADGRTLFASPEHPVRGGARVQDLARGDVYDGAAIVTIELVRFTGARTYDILPERGGIYWANGVPVESTLAQ